MLIAIALSSCNGSTDKKITTGVHNQPAAATKTEQQTAARIITIKSTINGENIYRGLCFSCHDVGVAEAPRPGDAAAWEPRIAAGMEAIYTNTINGKGGMPPRGGNPALSDDEVKAAVDWMVQQSR